MTGRSLPAAAAGGGWHRERPRAMGLGPRVPRPTLLAKPPGEPPAASGPGPGTAGVQSPGKVGAAAQGGRAVTSSRGPRAHARA